MITINITRTTTHVGVLKQLKFPSSLKGLLSSAVSFYETSAFNSYLYSNVDFLIVAYRNKTNNSFYIHVHVNVSPKMINLCQMTILEFDKD